MSKMSIILRIKYLGIKKINRSSSLTLKAVFTAVRDQKLS
jgi:hypothetical protein